MQQAHTEILEDFKFDDLASLLYGKMLFYVTDDDKKDARELIKKVVSKDWGTKSRIRRILRIPSLSNNKQKAMSLKEYLDAQIKALNESSAETSSWKIKTTIPLFFILIYFIFVNNDFMFYFWKS